MIFISTGGIRNKTAAETALEYYAHGIKGVELSGGMFSDSCESDLIALPKDLSLRVHNYFPPPQTPFVLNLAATDVEISRKSIAHIRGAIALAARLGCPTYSFHAGYRVNPNVEDLGRQLSRYSLVDRQAALEIFGERVTMLSEEAKRLGVSLLIENNVINMANWSAYEEDPLLLTHPEEINHFMQKMPSNVSLLLDVANLKVSGKTLKFDLISAHEMIKGWIGGYHLSDNDGNLDSNELITSDSWFWDLLIPTLDYYVLEVYRMTTPNLVSQYDFLSQRLNKMRNELKC